jgi:anti-sigma regulatory factor (Ser/Thr protein kinase)
MGQVEHTEADRFFGTAPRTLTALTFRVEEHRGPGAMRALGELPLAGQPASRQREWAVLEAMLNHVFADAPVHMLCSYDAQALPDHVLEPVPDAAASLRFDDRPAPSRDFVASRGAAAGLSGAALADLHVAAAEIITNAILHGRLPHWVHVWATEDEVLCEVQDGGRGIDSPFTGLIVPAIDAPAGRGVWIARQLCDRVDVSGARVRLHFRR